MCTETGIKDVYRGVQGACPRRAVTHAGGMAERSERRAVGMGLKLVYLIAGVDTNTGRSSRNFQNELLLDIRRPYSR